jgi:galactosylceramidase
MLAFFGLLCSGCAQAQNAPENGSATIRVTLDGAAGGDRFDGVGAVSGGGATTDLVKDYPEKQRSEILDLLFEPQFGASLSTLYVEVPGDGNSTQGTEPSHMHTRTDANYYRGYEWWLMREAKKRNPELFLDACAWSCPRWIGNGNFWSQDMCDYYADWIDGLKRYHGVTLDALGCRNESGVNEDFVKMLRATLDSRGLSAVKLHGFDNWGHGKWDWCKDLLTDPKLAAAVDVISNHTESDVPAPQSVQKIGRMLHKPIWDTEEHVYKDGFDCEISLVQAFNQNYLKSGVTQITNWYLVGGVYNSEPYPVQPNMLIANSPWSGSFAVRPVLWGYAHYGQFVKRGWVYLKGGCGDLPAGGSYVTFKSPGADYSIVAETKDASGEQTMQFHLAGGLSTGTLCVWRSNAAEQFVRQADIAPVDGAFTIELDPNSIYSLSTTTGQRKGQFDSPQSTPFPLPYYETFDHYPNPKAWGYLPHYTADIVGVFELANRPDHRGMCLRQVLDKPAQSWAPEWMPYTVIGDDGWKDYEVSADICLENGGAAGIMGRISSTGDGWHNAPKGYYLTVSASGVVELGVSAQNNGDGAGELLASGSVAPLTSTSWHKLKLRFADSEITGYVDGKQIVAATNAVSDHGLAGLCAGATGGVRNTALFDNLVINTVGGSPPKPTVFAQDKDGLY